MMMNEKPTDTFEREHRVIERAISTMARAADDLDSGRDVDIKILSSIVVFMRGYADRFHHGKEDAVLFPFLVALGVPDGTCPISTLSSEHQHARRLVGELTQTLAVYGRDGPSGREALARKLREITAIYPDHFWKEDNLLFPLTNKALSADEQEVLRKRIEAAEGVIDAEVHHQFEQWTPELWARV